MAPALPYELILLQHEALELAESVFALPGELVLNDRTAAFLPTLRDWIEAGGGDSDELSKTADWTDELAFQIHVSLDPPAASSSSTPSPLALSVKVPLVHVGDERTTTPEGAPFATVHLQQPPWLARNAYDPLSASLPSHNPTSFSSNSELILETVERAREEAAKLIPDEPEAPAPTSGKRRRNAPAEDDAPEFRVWLWFPSLSTKEKRDDIVNWAAEYSLTGFVLAGKPAILCLEGTEANVQAYLSDIKANSWADIPSFQKKVSERYRTPLLPSTAPPSADPTLHRIFTGMAEITSLIPRSGYRGHGSEMGEVKAFLESKGLGEAFGLIIGGGQFL
ncbi:hypothetical protein JCM10207_001301 [Rhodosporidiobolus poonsookiae]